MNKILYIQMRDGRLELAFPTAADAEAFLETQTKNTNWLALWRIERRLAFGKFHYVISTKEEITLSLSGSQKEPDDLIGQPTDTTTETK